MDRVYASNVSATPPSPPASPAVGYPRSGNPSTATEATKTGPYWVYMITESLRKLIVDAGLTPDHTNLNLVSQAVQAMIAGGSANDSKASARFTTTGNIVLSGLGTQAGGDWGAPLTAGDRIFAKDQTVGSENFLYIAAAGAWVRAPDADNSSEVTSGAIVAVEEGATLNDSEWMLTTDGTITIGTTALSFARIDSLQTIGIGQTWQNLTGSRSDGVTYYNLSNKPIKVRICSKTTASGSTTAKLTVNGVDLDDVTAYGANAGYSANVEAIIPPGHSYLLTLSGNSWSLSRWLEMR
ncbi:MAG: hypothetical protein CK604_00505 [Curvibacter sp. PD_MW3]|nr:MAG: hypothetical protein CK604_00505 [Curvibacter sp. PD_MW3]